MQLDFQDFILSCEEILIYSNHSEEKEEILHRPQSLHEELHIFQSVYLV